MLGQGISYCWGKLGTLKTRNFALWGPHTQTHLYQARWRLLLVLGTLGFQIVDLWGRELIGSDGFPGSGFRGIILSGKQQKRREVEPAEGLRLGSVTTWWGRVALGT